MAKSLLEDSPDFPPVHYLVGVNRYNLGKLYEGAGKLDDAKSAYREAIPLLQKAIEAEPKEVRNLRLLAMCRYNLGLAFAKGGKPDQADEIWNQSLRDWRVVILFRPFASESHSRAGATLSNLAVLASDRGDFKQCRRLAEEALIHQKRALRTEPVYKHAKGFLLTHYKHLSDLDARTGSLLVRWPEANAAPDSSRWSAVLTATAWTCGRT